MIRVFHEFSACDESPFHLYSEDHYWWSVDGVGALIVSEKNPSVRVFAYAPGQWRYVELVDED